jgi:VanZ family protein
MCIYIPAILKNATIKIRNKIPFYYLNLVQIMKMIKKNILSIVVALIIMYLSLASSDTFKKVPVHIPNFDKIVHFFMYLGLMSVIIFENQRFFKSNKHIFLTALIPLSYGILMEILQSLTLTRTASFYDALANAAGILVSILLWSWIKPFIKKPVI